MFESIQSSDELGCLNLFIYVYFWGGWGVQTHIQRQNKALSAIGLERLCGHYFLAGGKLHQSWNKLLKQTKQQNGPCRVRARPDSFVKKQ